MYKQYTCESCDAEFKIKCSLDETYYEVNFCPFCGGEINDERDDEDVDEE